MATHSDPTGARAPVAPPIQNGSPGQLVEFDDFIDSQLRKTRSHVRSVDVAGSLMLLAAGSLIYFLLAAMFDHWIVPGGLGFWGRTFFLAVYLVAAVSYLSVAVVPLVVRRINPLYAAHTIERSRPSLKNALVNFLLFRANPAGLSPVVYQAVEEQAATNLVHAPADAAVDRSKLIKIGYALAGILLVCGLYIVLSPKDLLTTVGRIAMPWAEISAPTRTTIAEVDPGSGQAFRGQQITVAARVQGLGDDGRVMLYYTTADGQIVDRPIEMTLPPDGYKYACQLPAAEASLQQNVSYRIEAGDAISPEYRIEVVSAPTIFVRSVEYKYPGYTGLLAQKVEQQGDIKAIEGTEITIGAVANGPIQSAYIDFDCDGRPDRRMEADGERAKATFPLALKEDRETPEHGSYQLLFKNSAGQQNPQPVRHQIEVTRDIAPEIQFVAPQQDEVDLPANGAMDLEIVATDPDFALALVKFSAMTGQKPLVDKILLGEVRRGQFAARHRFEPAKLGLAPGAVVEYSALAEDNKHPAPNRTETAKRRIRIVSPDERRGKQNELARNERSGEGQQPSDGQDGQGGEKKPPRDEQGDNQLQPDQPQQGEPGESGDSKNDNQRQSEKDTKGQRSDKQDKQEQGQGAQQKDSPEQDQGKQGERDAAGQKSGQEQGKSEGQKSGDDQQPAEQSVPNDGSNDGDAIERILERRDEQQNQNDSPTKQQEKDQQNQGGKEGQQKGAQQSGNERPPQDKQGDRRNARPEKPTPDGKGSQEKQDAGEEGRGQQPREGEPQGQDAKGKGRGQRGDRSGTEQPSSDAQAGDERQAKQKSGSKSDAPSNASQRQPDKSEGDGKQQQGEPAGQQDGRPPADRAKSGDKQARPSEKREGQPDNQPNADDDVRPADDRAPREKQGAGKADAKDAVKKDQRGEDAQESGSPDKGDSEREPTKGQGARSQTDPTTDRNPQSKDEQRSDAKGGDGEHQKGESGAGQKTDDKQGSPDAKKEARPRDKSPRPSPGDEDPKDPEQGQAASKSDKESDSEGQDDGEHSGGGKRGGGQKANKPGTGGAGQNTAADEGAGTSNEAGQGETSDRAGRDREGDKPTGESGETSGQGSSQKPATGENAQQGSKDSGGSQANVPQEAQGNDPGQQGTAGGGEPTGGQPGGRPNDNRPPDAPWKPGQEVADKANLEYARKATDLALSHLKDELAKDEPDPELLNRLGWTRKDLERFVARWEKLRETAQAPGNQGETARRELDETLRSLGLRPKSTSLGGQSARDDQVRGMKESRRTTPPPEYAEQTKAYTQGTARGGKK